MVFEQSDNQTAIRGLKRSDLIGDLSAESLAYLGSLAQQVELQPGTTLFFQDDDGDAAFIVEKGSIEISVMSENGKKLSLNVMQPPDVFGEIAALDGGPRTATATTLEATTVFRFDRSHLEQAIHERPEVAIDLIRILCARLRWVSQQVEDLALLDIEGRLAHRLLLLHRKFSDEDGCIHLSQSEIADFLGATRESINKVLQVWRAKGLIELSRGSVWVKNHDRLAAIAGIT